MLFSSITSFLLGFVNQGLLLLTVNLFAGLAASLIRPVEKAMIAQNIPESRRAEFNNVIHIFLNLGVIFGVVLATIMILVFNINYVFYLQSIIFLIAPVAFFVTYKMSKPNATST
jgi:MFS family permease